MTVTSVASDLMTAEEAAGYIGVAVQTLSVWRLNGRYNLPYKKVGRLIRYSRRDLDRWLTSRTRTATGSELAPAAQ